MDINFPTPRAKQCSYCTDPIAVIKVENSKYKVIEDRRDIICSKLCFHLFHEKCIYRWVEQGNSCPICRDEAFSRNIVHFDGFTAAYETYLNATEDTGLKPAANARSHRLSTRGGVGRWIGLLVVVSAVFYVIFKTTAFIYGKLKKPEPPPQDGKVLDVTPPKGANPPSPFLQKSPK